MALELVNTQSYKINFYNNRGELNLHWIQASITSYLFHMPLSHMQDNVAIHWLAQGVCRLRNLDKGSELPTEHNSFNSMFKDQTIHKSAESAISWCKLLSLPSRAVLLT